MNTKFSLDFLKCVETVILTIAESLARETTEIVGFETDSTVSLDNGYREVLSPKELYSNLAQYCELIDLYAKVNR